MNVVFAIGCKRYSDPDVAQLNYADQDARRFVETVMSTQDPDNTEKFLLHDEHEVESFRPTRSNILRFLSRGEDRDKRNELDFLFFYFSGHGWSSKDGTDYLLTSDSVVRMPGITAIPVPMLEGHLRNWEAKHVVLFIDACRTVRTGGKSTTVPEESRIDVHSLRIPGMVTFCSCEPGQTSYEADEVHSGVFTEGVCRALSNEGRCSTIQELDNYLKDKVPRIASEYGLPRQSPYSRVQPLGVETEIIVSQRTLKKWQGEQHAEAKQLPARTTTREEPLNIWRVQLLSTLEEHTSSVNSVTFSPDGRLLASGSNDNTVRLWRVEDWALLRTLKVHTSNVNSVAFSPDGRLLASGGGGGFGRGDRQVRLWQVDDRNVLSELKAKGAGAILSVAFSPDGQLLASSSDAGTLYWGTAAARLWRVEDGSLLHTLTEHENVVHSVVFSPDGTLVAAGSDDKTVRLWLVEDGTLLRKLEDHTGWVNSVAFSPDGRLLASGSRDKKVLLWRVEDWTVLRMLKGHTDRVNSVVFSPDGTLVASGSQDKTVRLWLVEDGTLLRKLEDHTGWVNSVAFSPDGRLLASGSYDKTVRLWSVG